MIKVDQLRFQYPKTSDQTLRSLNFEIAEGEIFGFLGPSGAGKSTCQKILYKILGNYQGNVLINGKDLKKWGSDYFNQIGVGFELPNHYLKLTGLENLKLFSSFYKKSRLHAFEDLFDWVGLSDDMHKPVDSYSKGMKMRLNFIRAIMHNPDIMFFDEPTSGMDPVNAMKIKDQIRKQKSEGKTVFITTHDMATADELCDRVAFLIDGEIKVTESPAVLKRKYGKRTVEVTLESEKVQTFNLDQLGENSNFLDFIQNDVQSMHSQEASLEEVFIEVTGKALS
jgi:fluoroquinolone transport system ATP-binding protein